MRVAPRRHLWGAAALAAASAAVFVTRAPFVATTLGDIDAVNFALALRDFDPVRHQPHPPGYPVYVVAARIVHAVIPGAARSLALLSAAAQAACVLPLMLLFRRLGSSPNVVITALLLTLTNPILWFNGARPMSDSFGLLLALCGQSMLLGAAASGHGLGAASLVAGLVPGARLQAGLLVMPLWVWALWKKPAWRPVACLLLSVASWATAVAVASGGLALYARAFVRTMAPALSNEPVWSALTLHRLVRAAGHVTIGPWQSPALGLSIWALAVVGMVAMWRTRRSDLRLALLAFGPYFAFHVLVQRVEAYRYSLPYVPLMAWLAAEGLWWAATAHRVSLRWAPRAVTLAAAGAAAVVTLPALVAYRLTPSPAHAAMEGIVAHAHRREAHVVAAHHMYSRYLPLLPPEIEVLPTRPRRELGALRDYWLARGRRTVLFVSEPRRTDLETIARPARQVLATWTRPSTMRRFLSGERPNRAQLVSIAPPSWFSAEGWLLSLEAGSVPSLTATAARRAYLSALDEPAFLLVAGEPVDAAASSYDMDLRLEGEVLERHRCAVPLLRGYRLPAASRCGDYRELVALTSISGEPHGAPFALRGLDYGPLSRPGWVLADGWHYPETDEEARPFRWASSRARALVHVPAQGASLRLAGIAPLEYVGPTMTLRIDLDGQPVHELRVRQPEFAIDVPLPAGSSAFREVALTADRSFVPNEVQRNGDRRELAVRAYDFRVDGAEDRTRLRRDHDSPNAGSCGTSAVSLR